MERKLHILHLEDNPRDAALVSAILAESGIQCVVRVIQSRRDFDVELQREHIDVILSDFSMPSYDGLSALRTARQLRPEIPFIFVSGKIGEEAAIESLKNGASDYLIKDRLARLPTAVERAVNEAEEKKKRAQAEATLLEHEEKLLRTQRLESLGTLAGGIAHDLNNALLPVLLGLEIIREKLPAREDQEMLAMIENSVARGTAMVRQVLTFARGTAGDRLLVNPLHLLRDIVQIAQRTLPAGITVRSDLPRNLWSIHCDPTQMHQVLLNLVVNARDAMSQGGTLTISGRNVSATEVSHRFAAEAAPGDYVLFEVSDTGDGIPEEIRDKIFEPFFTTKEVGKGTGLGLSTSLGIVKSHDGFFDFQTDPGRGTRFRFFLPGTRELENREQFRKDKSELAGKSEVVLIVDDELGVRELTKTILSMHGYQVLTAENGAEGVNQFKRFKDRIDAVLVDGKMPLMDGLETIRAIRQLSSDVKIIATTGQAAAVSESDFAGLRIDAFLPKPFTTEKVLQVLRECFERADRRPKQPSASS